MRKLTQTLAVFFIGFALAAQTKPLTGGQAYHTLKKLSNTTRVLYLAAHPDDENTRVISWLENGQGSRTAYLSLTRGDGGQNLIGTELGAKLGVLRTQELMQARGIDGGEQYFTRAVDFGYSKTADETFKQWNKKEVLGDVVWVIRNFQPDVIINRFPDDERAGHGHHTASAMLALEAFDLANDPKAYPQQLKYVNTWQPKRLFWNHSTWWRQNLDSIAAADKRYTIIDVGQYVPAIGLSCNELASHSRTQHKSQGFGVRVDRGSRKEYLQLLKGTEVDQHIFDGITKGWARYGWPKGDEMLRAITKKYEADKPYLIAEDLMELMKASENINNAFQKNWFQKTVQELFVEVSGLHLELLAPQEYITVGAPAQLELHLLNRSPLAFEYYKGKKANPERENSVAEVKSEESKLELIFGPKAKLPFNQSVSRSAPMPQLSNQTSQPYWLTKPYNTLFQVSNQLQIGQPENNPAVEIMVPISLNGKVIMLPVKGQYKYSDRVEGEIINPIMVVPSFTVNPSKRNFIFVNNKIQQLLLDVKAFAAGPVSFTAVADGWEVSPNNFNLEFTEANSTQTVKISLKPKGPKTQTATLKLQTTSGQAVQSITEINYPHIEKRVVFERAQAKLVMLDLAKNGQRIGYIKGAGDEVASAIEQMGYSVTFLSQADIKTQDLSQYHTIVAGIRAYNTQEWLPNVKDKLMAYVKQGGTYIVQYNTASRDLLSQDIGPAPFKLSRQRVTEEDAAVRFALPAHKILNSPNKIALADFEGWVQERGLYFAGTWDKSYQAPIAWHDQGEPDRLGGLLIKQEGEGAFIYTGISFFRELPAGVEGAYRLWANLLSYKPNIYE